MVGVNIKKKTLLGKCAGCLSCGTGLTTLCKSEGGKRGFGTAEKEISTHRDGERRGVYAEELHWKKKGHTNTNQKRTCLQQIFDQKWGDDSPKGFIEKEVVFHWGGGGRFVPGVGGKDTRTKGVQRLGLTPACVEGKRSGGQEKFEDGGVNALV